MNKATHGKSHFQYIIFKENSYDLKFEISYIMLFKKFGLFVEKEQFKQ